MRSGVMRGLCLAVVAMAGFGGPLAATGAAAQADDAGLIDETSYESPTFGYGVTWDDPWSVREADVRSSERRGDSIELHGDFRSTLEIIGQPATDLDPATAVSDALDDRFGDLTDGTPIWSDDSSETPGANLIVDDDRAQLEAFVVDDAVVLVVLIAPEEDFIEVYESVLDVVTVGDRPALALDPDTGPDATGTDDEDDEPEMAGIDGSAYESPAFGYALEWDDATWEPVGGTSEAAYDALTITSEIGTLYVEARETARGADAADCVAAEMERAEDQESIEDVTVGENEAGNPLEDEGDDFAWAVFTYTIEDPDGDRESAAWVECRLLEDGDVTLQTTAIGFDLDTFNTFTEKVLDVTGTLVLAGDDEPTANNVEPEDIALAEGGEGDSGSGTRAATAGTYTDETYGFSVSWDADVWSQLDEGGAASYLALDNGTTSLYIEGLSFAGTPREALDAIYAADAIESETVSGWEIAEDADGDPLTGSTGGGVYAVFAYAFTDEASDIVQNRVAYVEIRPLVDGETVLAITAVTYNRSTYNADVELVIEVIGTLQTTGEAPEPEPEDDEPDDVPEIDDEIWISRPLPASGGDV